MHYFGLVILYFFSVSAVLLIVGYALIQTSQFYTIKGAETKWSAAAMVLIILSLLSNFILLTSLFILHAF